MNKMSKFLSEWKKTNGKFIKPKFHWYFGHWHIDKDIDKKHTCLYNKIIPIGKTFM